LLSVKKIEAIMEQS